MVDFVKNTVLKPLLDRLGTILAVWLVAQGDFLCAVHNACGVVTPTLAEGFVDGLSILILLSVDWFVIQMRRKGPL